MARIITSKEFKMKSVRRATGAILGSRFSLKKKNSLIYFEDWDGNSRLCVLSSQRTYILSETYDSPIEATYAGYHKTYNRLVSTYSWPQMSQDVKMFMISCDICQKAKPRQHAPVGLLQPISIPNQLFEVFTMDFIPELSPSNGYDSILVIVNKLTKFATFIPMITRITE